MAPAQSDPREPRRDGVGDRTKPAADAGGVEVKAARRDRLAEAIFERLHLLMSWLAAVFVLVIVGDAIVGDESPFATIFTVGGWAIWGIFVLDLAVRAAIAPSTTGFLRRNWWQVLFLVLPFLALLRFFIALRVARAGRLVSAAVRGTRTAAGKLRSRLETVIAVTVMVMLLGANVLFEFGGVASYADALHRASLATITGEPTGATTGVAKLMEVFFALYSVGVFATVAGSLGAFFFERQSEEHRS